MLKQKSTVYSEIKRGSIFGFEDYLYRLPSEKLHALYDGREFFSEHDLGKVPKNKFFVKHEPTDTGIFESCENSNEVKCIDFSDIIEMQKRFPDVANAFC